MHALTKWALLSLSWLSCGISLLRADNIETLLSEQRWYAAEKEFKDISQKEVLSREREEQFHILQKYIKDEQSLEAAKVLFVSKNYYGASQCLAKIDEDFPKIAEVQEFKTKSNQELSLQEAELLFHMGFGEKSLEILKVSPLQKAKEMSAKVEKVLALVKECEAFEEEFEYVKAKDGYTLIEETLNEPDNAYSKNAVRFSNRIGDAKDFGLKMMAEGVRRMEKGNRLGAKKAFDKAMKTVPLLAKPKLEDLAKFYKQSYERALALEATQPEEAIKEYKELTELVELNSELYRNIQSRLAALGSVQNSEQK